jgi:hypothetical protein
MHRATGITKIRGTLDTCCDHLNGDSNHPFNGQWTYINSQCPWKCRRSLRDPQTLLFSIMKLLALAFELVLWGAATAATQATNTTYPYMDPSLSVPERVANLLSLMTLEEKLAQMMQGDVSNWLNTTSGEFNRSGLVENMKTKAGQFYVGYPVSWDWVQRETERAQRYLVEETRLGIPALVQTEGTRKNHFHYLDGV